MLRQVKELVLACFAVLLAVSLLAGVVREGYLLGLLVVAFLFWAFVPGGWKPLVSVIGTLFGIAILGCFLYHLSTSFSFASPDASFSLALVFLSLVAYLFRKLRRPKTDRSPRLSGAERTPVMPPGETGE